MHGFSALMGLLALFGVALTWLGTRRDHEPVGRWGTRLLAAAATGLTMRLLLGLWQVELELLPVWLVTDADTPLLYRLAAVWASQAGTWLIWGAFLAFLAIRQGPILRACVATFAGVLLLGAILTGLTLHTDEVYVGRFGTFTTEGTGPTALEFDPSGRGLDPLLHNPYMIIHPPVEFAAYALAIVVSLQAILSPTLGGWPKPSIDTTRLAWIAAFAALILGGLWARVTLSFGGAWAWDPVEVASLLVLVHTTAVLHGQHAIGPWGKHATVLLGAALWPTVALATVITRSGIWGGVHTFLASARLTCGPEGANLDCTAVGGVAAAAQISPHVLFGLSLLLAGVLAVVLLPWIIRTENRKPLYIAGGIAALALLTTFPIRPLLPTLVEQNWPVAYAAVPALALAMMPLANRMGPLHFRDIWTKKGHLAFATLLLLLVTLVLALLQLNVLGTAPGAFVGDWTIAGEYALPSRLALFGGLTLLLATIAFIPKTWPRLPILAGTAIVGIAFWYLDRPQGAAIVGGLLLAVVAGLTLRQRLKGNKRLWILALTPWIVWPPDPIPGILGAAVAIVLLAYLARSLPRKAGVPTIHLGLGVLVIGASFMLHPLQPTVVDPFAPEPDTWNVGERLEIPAGSLVLDGGRTIDDDGDGIVDRVHADYHGSVFGLPVRDRIELVSLGAPPRLYLVETPLTRGIVGDIDLTTDPSSFAIHVNGTFENEVCPDFARREWLGHLTEPECLPIGTVTAMGSAIRVTPLSPFMWAGAYLMLLGALIRLQPKEPAPKQEAPPVPPAQTPPPPQEVEAAPAMEPGPVGDDPAHTQL